MYKHKWSKSTLSLKFSIISVVSWYNLRSWNRLFFICLWTLFFSIHLFLYSFKKSMCSLKCADSFLCELYLHSGFHCFKLWAVCITLQLPTVTLCIHSFSGISPPSSIYCILASPVISHFTVLFPIFPSLHVASCVHCVWAPISGPPVLWARRPCLLWETFWHGEGIKDRPVADCCPVSHFCLLG